LGLKILEFFVNSVLRILIGDRKIQTWDGKIQIRHPGYRKRPFAFSPWDGKIRIQDPRSMINVSDHISES
jgi:hypothetical protein